MAFALKQDGNLGEGRVLVDTRNLSGDRRGGYDGLTVDARGNLWATGPGGVLVFSPKGKHLGTLLTTQRTSNCTFGGTDGRTLFITADMYLLGVQTASRGLAFDKKS